MEVRHNPEKKRFEVEMDGKLAVADYLLTNQLLTLTHTEVPEALEGRGIGSKLAQAAIAFARAQSLTVLPVCAFMAAYFRRHPEQHDVLLEDFKL